MKVRYRKRVRVVALCMLCFCVLVIHSFFSFENTFFKMQMKQKQQELERTAKIKAETVTKKYEEMVASLETIAQSVVDEKITSKEDVGNQVSLLAKIGHFDCVGISDPHGHAMDSMMNSVDIQEREYFKEAMQGRVCISDVIISQVEVGKEIQVLAVPIKDHGAIKGVVFGIMHVGSMDKLMENETGTDIYTQIIDPKGNYVTRVKTKDSLMKHSNVWEDFAEFDFLDVEEEKIREDLKLGKADGFSFRMGEEERVSFYTPLGLKGYYVFSTIDSAYLKDWTQMVNMEIIGMMVEIGIAFLILLAGLTWFSRSVKKELQEVMRIEQERERALYQKRAEIDELTGLYNAATVKRKIHDFINSESGRHGSHVFFLMDLDNFKQINDTFGHQYGDRVLQDVARTLRRNLRRDDFLGRLGGDEFVALLINATEFENMESTFQKLCRELEKSYTKDGKTVKISASFGIVETPKYGTSFHEIYKKSDKMLYEVKRNEKNGFRAYKES